MRTRYKYTIEIIADTEEGAAISCDEVKYKIRKGYHSGSDGNEDEEYSFSRETIEEDN